MQDGSAIAIIIQAQQQKQLVRLAQSVQRQEDYDTAVKPTFYQGYDQNTGTAIATTQGFSTSNKYRVITNAPLSNGDRVNIRPSNGLDRVDAISTRKKQQQVPKIKIAKPKVTGEGNASYDSDTDSYILTTTEAPTVAQVGGISNFTKVKDPLFRFDFEFRIYGNTTPLFADGLAFSYTPSPLGAAGAALGVGALGLGFACGIRTFFENEQQDQNQVRAFGRFGGGGFIESGNDLSLRSPSWQSASIQVLSNSVNFRFGGVELNLVMPTPPLDYFLRISAATAQYNDNHEVRNLRLNGRRVRFVPPVPLVPPP